MIILFRVTVRSVLTALSSLLQRGREFTALNKVKNQHTVGGWGMVNGMVNVCKHNPQDVS